MERIILRERVSNLIIPHMAVANHSELGRAPVMARDGVNSISRIEARCRWHTSPEFPNEFQRRASETAIIGNNPDSQLGTYQLLSSFAGSQLGSKINPWRIPSSPGVFYVLQNWVRLACILDFTGILLNSPGDQVIQSAQNRALGMKQI